MKKDKEFKSKDFIMVMLIACLTSLSIAYATISATLTITNELTVKAHNWDIHFENLKLDSIEEDNTAAVITGAQIESGATKISGLKVDFKKPGDHISYTFDVKNAGEIDAKLTSINIGTPVCEPTNVICNDIEYSLKYADGNDIEVSDTLSKGDSVKLRLTINYKSSSTQVINEDVIVNGLDAVLVYAQK